MKQLNLNYDYYNVPRLANLWELVELRKDLDKTAFLWREDGRICRKKFSEVYADVKALSGYLRG